MRIAECRSDLKLQLMGNQSSVAIGKGWKGDLDQVIGVTDRGPMTVADALGPHLTDTNFLVAPLETRKGPAPAAKPNRSQE
jgi:hypothetical protein